MGRDAAVTSRDHETTATQIEPACSVHRICVVGIPIDIVDRQSGVLLRFEGSINPVAVVEEEPGAHVKRAAEGVVVGGRAGVRKLNVQRVVEVALFKAVVNRQKVLKDTNVQSGR